MSGIIDPYTGATQTGSLYINNYSFSGVDIKAVFHIYNPRSTSKTQILQSDHDIAAAIADRDSKNKQLSSVSTSLASARRGTQEQLLLAKKHDALLKEINRSDAIIKSMQDRQAHISINSSDVATKVMIELQTLSLSTHRDKRPVRACGFVGPKGFTRGPREYAGSMVFTTFNKHVLYNFLESHPSDFDGEAFGAALMDQLPPIDITLSFANEYGSVARLAIYGVEFFNEGQVFSIEDIFSENTVNFFGRSYDPMRDSGQRKTDANNLLLNEFGGTSASDLLLEDEYQNTKSLNDPFERFKRREYPYL